MQENKDIKDVDVNSEEEHDMSMIEQLMTEHEDDSNFGKWLSRANRNSFNIIEHIQNFVTMFLSVINFITSHLFLISFLFVIFSVIIVNFL